MIKEIPLGLLRSPFPNSISVGKGNCILRGVSTLLGEPLLNAPLLISVVIASEANVLLAMTL